MATEDLNLDTLNDVNNTGPKIRPGSEKSKTVFTPDGTAYYPQPELKYGTKTLKISAKIDIGTSGG